MKAKLVSVTEPEGKPIWFRTYEFECIDCGKHFTRHRFDSRTNPYCAGCHRKHENERQRERIEAKKQMAINDVLNKIRAEIDEQYDRIRPYNIDVAEGLEMALGILDNIGKESEVKPNDHNKV